MWKKTINILMSLRRVYRSSRLRFSDVRTYGHRFFFYTSLNFIILKKEKWNISPIMNNKMIFVLLFFFTYTFSVSSFFFHRQPASFGGGGGRNDAIKNVFRRRLRFRMYFPRKPHGDTSTNEGEGDRPENKKKKRAIGDGMEGSGGMALVAAAAAMADVKSVCATKLICRFLGSFPSCSIWNYTATRRRRITIYETE